MIEPIAKRVLEESIKAGVEEYCICPGARSAPLIALLKEDPQVKTYYFNDERCASFFALGRSRASQKPVAIVTTSGTAVAHLLAAAMEAYYTGVPLVLMTADRPRRIRETNAPQSCKQVGIFSHYAPTSYDLAQDEPLDLSTWDRAAPLHLNVCLEETAKGSLDHCSCLDCPSLAAPVKINPLAALQHDKLSHFLSHIHYPLVIVNGLPLDSREAVLQFLLQLNAPVYIEGVSGLREDPRLKHLSLVSTDTSSTDYPLDGVLRIGGVPTVRLWRDLEKLQGKIQVLSINDMPFAGLSWPEILCTPLKAFFQDYSPPFAYPSENIQPLLERNKKIAAYLTQIIQEEPQSEVSLVHQLSCQLPEQSLIFLGNSLPIREWDLAASRMTRGYEIQASRGLSGIDGQISTFYGLSEPNRENWAIIGDLTALHDVGAGWILDQLPIPSLTVVVIHNGGGKIFTRVVGMKELQNRHSIHFEPIAKLWGMDYERWEAIPSDLPGPAKRLIELIPDDEASQRFWEKWDQR